MPPGYPHRLRGLIDLIDDPRETAPPAALLQVVVGRVDRIAEASTEAGGKIFVTATMAGLERLGANQDRLHMLKRWADRVDNVCAPDARGSVKTQ